jgi:hypothetical protein
VSKPLSLHSCLCLNLSHILRSEIQAKADAEVASAQELVQRKVDETEILRKKMTEFHSHLSAVMSEKDNALKIQNSLLAAQDSLKLRHRFLEVSTRGKVTKFTPHDLTDWLIDDCLPLHLLALLAWVPLSFISRFQSLFLMPCSLFLISPTHHPIHCCLL